MNFKILTALIIAFLISFSSISLCEAQVQIIIRDFPGERVPAHGGHDDNTTIICAQVDPPKICFRRVCFFIGDILSPLVFEARYLPDVNLGSLSVKDEASGAYYDDNGNLVTQTKVKYLQPLEPYRSFTDFMDACIKYSKKLVE